VTSPAPSAIPTTPDASSNSTIPTSSSSATAARRPTSPPDARPPPGCPSSSSRASPTPPRRTLRRSPRRTGPPLRARPRRRRRLRTQPPPPPPVLPPAARQGQIIHYGRPPEFFAPARPDVRQRLRTEWGADDGDLVCPAPPGSTPSRAPLPARSPATPPRQPGLAPAAPRLGRRRPRANPLAAAVRDLGAEDASPSSADAATSPTARRRRRLRADVAGGGHAVGYPGGDGQGLPVCAAAVGGVPEQLGDAGRLLPDPRDPDGTADALPRRSSPGPMTPPHAGRKASAAASRRGPLPGGTHGRRNAVPA
jgi:hypothetical protein